MTPLLMPCPFCGCKAEFIENKKTPGISNWSVGCSTSDDDHNTVCFGYQSMAEFARKQEAAEAWNRRDTYESH